MTIKKRGILGISSFYHDSAVTLLIDGKIFAAAQEERFTRVKNDPSFPKHALKYVLDTAGLEVCELEAIAFYDKPFLKFERLLETYHSFAPKGLRSFLKAMPIWIKEKLFLKKVLLEELKKLDEKVSENSVEILFPEHHLSHCSSAFYPSPFESAAILTVDGVGEWVCTSLALGSGNSITSIKEQYFPHSIGLLYSAFTYYLGFKVNSGEYKLMGLAPYGNPKSNEKEKYKKIILEEMTTLKTDGSIQLNMSYFDFAVGTKMCNPYLFESVLGLPKREPETELNQSHMNLALAIQEITEEAMIRLAVTLKELTKEDNLVLAGGVALNCVANGKILRENIFKNVWIQPAAGDSGGSLGAAFAAYHIGKGYPRVLDGASMDQMKGGFLGPSYTDKDVLKLQINKNAVYDSYIDFEDVTDKISQLLAKEKIVGWFQNRMEWGPRALGNRSILADPRSKDMQKKLNLNIKYREGFRPFAPAILAEYASEYFDLEADSPYMMMVYNLNPEMALEVPDDYDTLSLYERLYVQRSEIPAVTHVDFSARVQTVHKDTNPEFHQLINKFNDITNCPMLVNTSFNVRGEPIVLDPEAAYRCFMRTEMDVLVINKHIFIKQDQPHYNDLSDWENEYELD
jgi:carbamoyltransferase